MRRFTKVLAYLAVPLALASVVTVPRMEALLRPDAMDGVSRSPRRRHSLQEALVPGSLSFEPSQEFLFSLPLQVYMNLRAGAFFLSGPRWPSGNGVVLDIASFRVTGYSPPYALAWNSIEGVNADGTIPALPQFILFRPEVQNVSVKVASNTSAGQTAFLLVVDSAFATVGGDSVTLTPAMQTLSVSSATRNIRLGILGGAEVMVADDFIFN